MRVSGCTALALLVSCAGQGRANWTAVEPAIAKACGHCHDASKIERLTADIKALDDAQFTDASFPDAVVPTAEHGKSPQDYIQGAGNPDDAFIDPSWPRGKVLVVHELNELKKILTEDPPPDYRTQDSFDAFVVAGKPGAWEGCEVAEKLELGLKEHPDGMPPLWARPVFELLKADFTDATPAERQALSDYVDALLPGGLKACSAAPGESS